MEKIKIDALSFTYPGFREKALDDITLELLPGEYIVLVGKSGCGKTTLLRHLKPQIAPHGEKSGRIFFGDREISELTHREQSEKIAFVFQNPDNQLVTDKVWHELAFTLENLGVEKGELRRRISETASYFGLDDRIDRDVATLSGGEKQLLNLAAAVAAAPDILILDEPTAQLDPMAAAEFLSTLSRLNRDLGITVVISEHRLEEVFSHADKIALMDKGKIIAFLPPQELGEQTAGEDGFMKFALPSAMRIYSRVSPQSGACPVTVSQGRRWLGELLPGTFEDEVVREPLPKGETALAVRDLYFGYSKKDPLVLKGLSCEFEKGRITALLGGNGVGKSTLMKLCAGIYKPLSGKITRSGGSVTYLPQQVQTVFTEKTVAEDLRLISPDIDEVAALTGIEKLLARHPYDLSGGEAQRAALAKALLTSPQILLLDEPTKGMDGQFKEQLAELLLSLAEKGCAVVLCSHDVEFSAKYAHRCMMLFGGEITSVAPAREFFAGNNFYTTAAHRMSRNIFKNAVTDEEVVYLCKKNLTR